MLKGQVTALHWRLVQAFVLQHGRLPVITDGAPYAALTLVRQQQGSKRLEGDDPRRDDRVSSALRH